MLEDLCGLEDKSAMTEYLRQLESSHDDPAVMIIDIDDFKLVNDQSSHLTGDDVIATVRRLIAELASRYKGARAFKYGGDEVCVILTSFAIQEAFALAEHLRVAITTCGVPNLLTPLTATVGVAGPPTSGVTVALGHADVALREGKQGGKNRVVLYDPNTLPRETRRLVVSPKLFDAVGKSLRLTFLSTGSYHRAGTIAQTADVSMKCVSVLGSSDLLFIHLGENDKEFFAQIQPLLIPSGVDSVSASNPPLFVAAQIHKWHGYLAPVAPVIPPPRDVMSSIAAAAQAASSFTDEEQRSWKDAGYVLGVEDRHLRAGQIEAYMTVALSLPVYPPGQATEMLVHKLLMDTMIADRRVFSLYEGYGSTQTGQFILRMRSTPNELFDFIEHLHKQAYDRALQAHTGTHVVVECKAFRLYDNLRYGGDL